MSNDDLHFSFNIYSPASLLLWASIICFLGIVITGTGLLEINKFMIGKNGIPISLLQLQKKNKSLAIKLYLSNISEQCLTMVRKHLKLDFLFMFFLYVQMVVLTCLATTNSTLIKEWEQNTLVLLPFLTWVFDIVENCATLSIIESFRSAYTDVTQTQTKLMFIGSILKWVTAGAWVLGCIHFLIVFFASFSF